MSLEPSLSVYAAGSNPIEFRDDLDSQTVHRLLPGHGLHKSGGGWEPTPLPEPQQLVDDRGWEPPRLPRSDPRAIRTLLEGKRTRVLLDQSKLALSEVRPLVTAAEEGGGHLVLELRPDV